MTMTNLDGKIDDTVETLNLTAQRRSLNGDEKFLADLITAYEQSQNKISQMESAILEDYEAFKSNKAAYEQSQKELEEYKFLRSNGGAAKFLKAELETANKANTELLAALKGIELMAENPTSQTIEDIKEDAKEALSKHKGEQNERGYRF